MTPLRLLARLVPGIYADPNRPRRCRVCGSPMPPAPFLDRVCSDRCHERDAENQAFGS